MRRVKRHIDEERFCGALLRDVLRNLLRQSEIEPVIITRGMRSFCTGAASAVAGIAGKAKAVAAPTDKSLEVVLVPDSSLWDGRYVNNGWLQEAPDPVTKLTWDNAALLGSVTYRGLGFKAQKEGLAPKVKITVGGKTLVLPALEAPGHANNSITIQLGYGQTVTGFIGKGTGFNGYALLSNAGEYVLTGATIEATGEDYQLAITQEHETMEGRALYREGTK